MRIGPRPRHLETTPPKDAVVHSFKPGQSLEKLDELLSQGAITSYSQEGDHIVVQTNPQTDKEKLEKALSQPATLPLLAKASQLFVPPDMSENCAPEYLRFRLWQLGGAVCGGALGFMNAQIALTALNSSFPKTETAALAGSIVGTTGTLSAMGASFLAKKGDADPKRSYMNSALLATANTIGTMAGLWLLPKQYLPLMLGSTVMGSVAGGLGGSAGLNIANHMAKEQARGTVGAKNANQDRVAGFLGVPLALALSRTASAAGLNPTVTTMGVLAAALLVCNVESATSLRFEAVDRQKLETLVGDLLDGKKPPKAETGQIEALKEMVWPRDDQPGKLNYLSSSAPLAQPERIRTLAREDYLVGLDTMGRASLVFRKNSSTEGLIQGVAQALLLERCAPLRAQAEELAPGKGELLLTELSYRALPRGGNWKEQLSHSGWHVHAEKLKVGTEDRWRGSADNFSPIPLEDLTRLLKEPSANGLRDLLKDSPLLEGQPAPSVTAR